ncbi:MAG: sigma-E processing peptidase SpoIIGA [Firmicutes bacterium]|nr:sigma-E processing peptidase SpoIIGA [Bacillota bacterium]
MNGSVNFTVTYAISGLVMDGDSNACPFEYGPGERLLEPKPKQVSQAVPESFVCYVGATRHGSKAGNATLKHIGASQGLTVQYSEKNLGDNCIQSYNEGASRMVRIYLDSLLLLIGGTFALDFLTLWAVGHISGRPTRAPRLAKAALISAILFVAVVALSDLNVVALASPASLAIALLAAGASLAIAYPGIGVRAFVISLFYRYLLTVMAGGAAVAAHAAASGSKPLSFLAAIATVIFVAEAGWGAVHRGMREGLFYVPVSIRFGHRSVSLTALIDTGNLLRDPLSGVPAVIVEYSAIEPLLPHGIRASVQASDTDFVAAARAIADSPWSTRFRAVPYSSVGQTRGLMIGFRPSEIRLLDGKKEISTDRAIVCVHNSSFCPTGKYRALLNPEILIAG